MHWGNNFYAAAAYTKPSGLVAQFCKSATGGQGYLDGVGHLGLNTWVGLDLSVSLLSLWNTRGVFTVHINLQYKYVDGGKGKTDEDIHASWKTQLKTTIMVVLQKNYGKNMCYSFKMYIK